MLTDQQIASQVKARPIIEISRAMGIDDHYLQPYGENLTKVSLRALQDTRPS